MVLIGAALLGCTGESPAPSEPAPAMQVGVKPRPTAGPAAPVPPSPTSPTSPTPPAPGVVKGLKVPEVQTVDKGWAQLPTQSRVSQPGWPNPLVEPGMCGQVLEGLPLMDDGCLTAELRCGDSVIGHTKGGTDRYDTRFYEDKHCWPATRDHDGGSERVYKLTAPPGEWRAWVTLYSPCADLNVAGLRHDGGSCPTLEHDIRTCEMSVKPGRVADRIELTSQTYGTEPTWYLIVEGLGDVEGLFSLHVQCAPGLGGPLAKDKTIGWVD